MLRHLLLVLLVFLFLVSFLLRRPLLATILVAAIHLLMIIVVALVVILIVAFVVLLALIDILLLVLVTVHLVLHAATVLIGTLIHVLVIVLLLALEVSVVLLELLRFAAVIVLALGAASHALIVVGLVVGAALALHASSILMAATHPRLHAVLHVVHLTSASVPIVRVTRSALRTLSLVIADWLKFLRSYQYDTLELVVRLKLRLILLLAALFHFTRAAEHATLVIHVECV